MVVLIKTTTEETKLFCPTKDRHQIVLQLYKNWVNLTLSKLKYKYQNIYIYTYIIANV